MQSRLVVVGSASGDIPEFKANYLLVKNIPVLGRQWSDSRERAPDWIRRVQAEIVMLYSEGKFAPEGRRTFRLPRFADALRLLRDGQAQGKIVLQAGDSA